MKTTVDIPDLLFRRAKAAAAMHGESLRDFFVAAVHAHLISTPAGWRTVFGKAKPAMVRDVDGIVEREFSRVNPEDWR